jgi:molybdenum cofactor cytidylyltransferase
MSGQDLDRKPLAVVILAAGESRRMGFPKLFAEWRKKTFAECLIQASRHPRVGITRIVIGAHQDEVRRKLNWNPKDIVLNADWEQGQLSSVQAGIYSLPENATAGMILWPIDHPAASADLFAKLIEEFDASGSAIVLPTYEGKRGHPVIFRADLYQELLNASPDVGARQVVWAHADDVREVPTKDEAVVVNFNDREAIDRYARKLGIMVSDDLKLPN